MTAKTFTLLSFLLSLHFSSLAQVSIGPHISRINIPAASFKSIGGGVTAELDGRYTMQLDYFDNKQPLDSVAFVPGNGGSTIYTQYEDQYNFIQLSAAFLVHLVGGASSENKFSLYLGGGLAGMYRMEKFSYKNVNPPVTQKENKVIGGFEFSAGADYDAGFAKIFLRGKETIFLSHLLPVSDDTALPLLANTQLGILIPLHKSED